MPIPSEDLFGSELYQSTIARYYLEHKELVSSFYNLDDPEMRERFLLSLLESQGATVPYMYAQLCQIMEKDDGVKQVDYSPERFRFQFLPATESGAPFDCNLAIITPPPPERPPLCERIFLLFSNDLERQGYFTVELSIKFEPDDPQYLLCGWNPYGAHFNCGIGFQDPNEEDGERDPDFLVAPGLATELYVNKLPNRIKKQLRAVYAHFSGQMQPKIGLNPERLNELLDEWKKTHPGQELTSEEEISRLMLRSMREEDD